MTQKNGFSRRNLTITLFALIAVLILASPAMAITAEYNESADSGGGGLALRSHILFNITVRELVNMTTLQEIEHQNLYVVKPTSDTGYTWQDYSTGFTASISDNTGLHEVGSGTIYAYFISNVSTTGAYYRVVTSFDSWDKSAVTGGLTGQKHVNLSYDYAALGIVPSYRNSANLYPTKYNLYNTSAFLSYETPTDTNFYVPMGVNGYSIFATYLFTPAPPRASISCNSYSGVAPLNIACTAVNSTGLISTTTWGSIPLAYFDNSTGIATNVLFNNAGVYQLNFTAANAYGSDIATQEITVTSAPTGVALNLDVKSALPPNPLIAGSAVSIQNLTDGTFGNTTASTGMVQFVDVGGIILTVGQQVGLCASATGFSPVCENVTIPYDEYTHTLYLPAFNTSAPEGFTNFIIVVKRDKDYAPVPGVSLSVLSGVGTTSPQPCIGTDSDGIGYCGNISVSTSASVTAVHQQYNTQTITFPVTSNTTTTHYMYLVLKGDVPVTSVQTPYPTGTVYDPNAPGVYPTPTDAYGNPITEPDQKGAAALGVFADAAYAVAQIAVGCLFIWLLWEVVYLMTGGRIIDKIMRRGRRR